MSIYLSIYLSIYMSIYLSLSLSLSLSIYIYIYINKLASHVFLLLVTSLHSTSKCMQHLQPIDPLDEITVINDEIQFKKLDLHLSKLSRTTIANLFV